MACAFFEFYYETISKFSLSHVLVITQRAISLKENSTNVGVGLCFVCRLFVAACFDCAAFSSSPNPPRYRQLHVPQRVCGLQSYRLCLHLQRAALPPPLPRHTRVRTAGWQSIRPRVLPLDP